MRSYDEILAISAARKGGEDAVFAGVSRPKTPEELAAIPDDRWLSMMSRMVFNAGFNWKVVEAKWPAFEEALEGFDIGACALMDDDRLAALARDPSIIRNAVKLHSVRENASFIARHPGFGRLVGDWPAEDYIGLLDFLKAEATRMGGTTGQYFLRMMGKDGFILSRDVTARLIAEGVIDKPAGGKAARRKVQAAFDQWAAESGRSLTEISRTLATSTG